MMSSTPANEEQRGRRVFENASAERISLVFKQSFCDATSKVKIVHDGEASLKAAVTMAFPRQGLVDCLAENTILMEIEPWASSQNRTVCRLAREVRRRSSRLRRMKTCF